jgi:general secretion pathway protein E
MVMSDELKTLIIQTYDSNRIKALATQEKMISLREDGIEKVLEGMTTLEEVLRVTQG